MKLAFTTQERKKEFEKIFKSTILPLFTEYGFQRHTKTSKRMFKSLGNDLSVFVFMEYKSRFGCYDITIAYFDAAYGDVYDDNYLAMVAGRNPSFNGDNVDELSLSISHWIEEMKILVFPFIEKHDTHQSILDSTEFYISKARESEIIALLKRKSV
jgi:hypothetical protein